MKKERNEDDVVASVGDQLRQRVPSAAEERVVLDRVWSDLRQSRVDVTGASASRRGPQAVLFVASAFLGRRSSQSEGGRRKSQMQLAAAAVLVLAAAIGTAMVWRSADDPLFRIVEGDVRVGDPPSLLRSVGGTGTIRSNGGVGAVLELADTSRLEMRSHTELSLERARDGVRIRLSGGGIIVNAAKQRTGHLYVLTRDMTVSVVGTVFVVNTDAEGSRVTVIEGEVRVLHGSSEKKLRPGERVATSPNAEGFALASELAWSRRADALVELLRRSTVEQQPPGAAAQATKEPRIAFEVVTIRPHGSGPGGGRSGGGGGGGGMNPFAFGCAGSVDIDPRRFARIQTTIWDLITVAYSGNPNGCRDVTLMNVISGGPAWIKSDFWDVVALIPEGVLSAADLPRAGHWRNEKPSTLQKMVERMLLERVGLVLRREIREAPAYALKMVGAAPKFTPPPLEGSQLEIWKRQWDTNNMPSGRSVGEPGGYSGKDVYMKDVVELLAGTVGRPVADETGFSGSFSFRMTFRPAAGTPFSTNSRLAGFPDIFTALEQQVGLRLEETTAKTEFWVIERVERPTEN